MEEKQPITGLGELWVSDGQFCLQPGRHSGETRWNSYDPWTPIETPKLYDLLVLCPHVVVSLEGIGEDRGQSTAETHTRSPYPA